MNTSIISMIFSRTESTGREFHPKLYVNIKLNGDAWRGLLDMSTNSGSGSSEFHYAVIQ